RDELLVLLGALLLRTDQQEVEEHQHAEHEDELLAAAAAGGLAAGAHGTARSRAGGDLASASAAAGDGLRPQDDCIDTIEQRGLRSGRFARNPPKSHRKQE